MLCFPLQTSKSRYILTKNSTYIMTKNFTMTFQIKLLETIESILQLLEQQRRKKKQYGQQLNCLGEFPTFNPRPKEKCKKTSEIESGV